MTTAINLFFAIGILGSIIILAMISLLIVAVRDLTKLFTLVRATQAEIKTIAQAVMPHVNFDAGDQSKVEIQEGWDEKRPGRD